MADNGRSYILDRMRSKKTSIEEFNFDRLQAPPLAMFFTPFDIAELREIATSLKLSGKPELRYKMIDEICRRRGLVKFGSGTNRVVYRHPEFNDILFKIASDDVGMGDNPAEFRNQFLLKPFVAKMFEVSPCGTVSVVERVKPFLNREEFRSVAEDVFELINTWVIGKYIVADCGSRYFMNFGVRSGFGIVLLDYPYLYELDGNKLYCKAPNPNNPSGMCDGIIDYDDGFNYLHCTKCGARYRAKELAKEIKNNKIILKKEGDINMKITIKGGTNNVNKKVIDGVVVENNEAMQTIGDSMKKAAKKAPSNFKKKNDVNEKTVNGVSMHHSSDIIKIEEPVDVVEPVVEQVKEEDDIFETIANDLKTSVVDEAEDIVEVVDNIVEDSDSSRENLVLPSEGSERIRQEDIDKSNEVAEKIQLVGFDSSLIGNVEVDNSTPVFDIEKSMISIIENINSIKIDDVKLNTIENIVSKISNVGDVDKLEVFKLLIKVATGVINNIDDGDIVLEALKDSTLLDDFIGRYYTVKTDKVDIENGVAIESYFGLDDDDTIKLGLRRETITNIKKDDSDNSTIYNGMDWYAGTVVDIKDLFPNVEEDYKALIISDDKGNYITDEKGYIVAVDQIDNISIDNAKIVSRSWYESLSEDADVVSEDEDSRTVYSVDENGETSGDFKEANVGVFPENDEE